MIPLPAIPWAKALRLAPYALLAVFFALWLHRGDVIKRERAEHKAAVAQQEAGYRAAYNRAVNDALAEKQAKEKQYEAAREKSAAAYADLSQRYRSVVLRLAPAADPRSAGKADLSGRAESAGLPEAPTADAFVSISRADALICADNTAYAQGAYEWAKGL